MALKIYTVDAFTDRLFRGNPAAVCVLPAAKDAEWMQDVAREMNLSETAFLLQQAGGYQLRWFTPAVEVDLCGHATLASAHVLWQEGYLPPDQLARFYSRSGLLTAERQGNWIELDFPAEPAQPVTEPEPVLERALRVPLQFVGKNRMDYLVEIANENLVRHLAPDFSLLAQEKARGFIVTAKASRPGFDFVSRFFAPSAGVPEDPVTGSAHCCLGPYWQNRLGKADLLGLQISARSGVVRVGVRGERIRLAGQAVSVLRAELLQP